jgi:hypothetical protein
LPPTFIRGPSSAGGGSGISQGGEARRRQPGDGKDAGTVDDPLFGAEELAAAAEPLPLLLLPLWQATPPPPPPAPPAATPAVAAPQQAAPQQAAPQQAAPQQAVAMQHRLRVLEELNQQLQAELTAVQEAAAPAPAFGPGPVSA